MDMNVEQDLAHYLDPLHLGCWVYHPVVGSTNDLALDWAKQGAPDWALVVADQQRAGRGRGGRRWITQPGAGLAISLVLRPSPDEQALLPRFTALGALGVVHTLADMGLITKIKWPNDILLKGKKVGGVLVETEWQENRLTALVIGLGVNVFPDAVPPEDQLHYPGISVIEVLGMPIDRWALLAEILKAMMALRSVLTGNAFMNEWNKQLAFRGDLVSIKDKAGKVGHYRISGVTGGGKLALLNDLGETVEIVSCEICIPSQ